MTAAGGTWVREVPQTETAREGHARLTTSPSPRRVEVAAKTYLGRAPAGNGVPVVVVGHARVGQRGGGGGGMASRGIIGCAVMSLSSE